MLLSCMLTLQVNLFVQASGQTNDLLIVSSPVNLVSVTILSRLYCYVQGFWPDGLYSPPTDEALIYDLKLTKELGFNMLRKHTKVESDRW